MITIGIDPHKSSLTALALDPSGQIADSIRLPVDATVVGQLLGWAQRWDPRRWAVEGAAGLGRGVAQGLAMAGEFVVDVPAQLVARARLLDIGHARKTDAIDAAYRRRLGRGGGPAQPPAASGPSRRSQRGAAVAVRAARRPGR